ncbi:hypothetical protein C8F04DRAFT_1102977 [Mycena alexandri]|uniref:F-box domain-containing protein n=1 Tax=Mycena alexandri TaxID=1745969 RepID=A0AAD6SVY6_9AGAR|nr:hypothetical protein C8F04DRAFT_1102977 [Mycena alexandri]
MTHFIPVPAFPPEITDSIIHELGPELPALRICSQVCRAWLPASRHILHQTLKLRGEEIAEFVEIIASSENTYFATLRGIELSLCENGPTTELLNLLPKFLCLKSIGIYSSIFYYEFPILPGVTTLEFRRTEFRSLAVFTILLGQTPNLKSLTLSKVKLSGWVPGWAPTGVDLVPSKSIPGPELDVLHVELTKDRALLDWLTSEVSAPSTLALELFLPRDSYGSIGDTDLVDKASKYLQYLGIQLKRLHLRFSGSTQIQMLNVSTNTALRSIRIDFFNVTFNARSWTTYFSATLPSLLERFRSNDIDELIVDMNMIPDKKDMDIKRLSATLTSSRFAGLRRLQFNGQWDAYAARGKKTARKIFTENVIDRLPVSSSCSILLVDPSKDQKQVSRSYSGSN